MIEIARFTLCTTFLRVCRIDPRIRELARSGMPVLMYHHRQGLIPLDLTLPIEPLKELFAIGSVDRLQILGSELRTLVPPNRTNRSSPGPSIGLSQSPGTFGCLRQNRPCRPETSAQRKEQPVSPSIAGFLSSSLPPSKTSIFSSSLMCLRVFCPFSHISRPHWSRLEHFSHRFIKMNFHYRGLVDQQGAVLDGRVHDSCVGGCFATRLKKNLTLCPHYGFRGLKKLKLWRCKVYKT